MIIRAHTSLSYRNNPYRNSRGFTLVEALVGLVILALGLLSLARFHTSLIESSGLTKARTAAINYGQNKMEELRNLIEKGEFIDTSSAPYSPGSQIALGSNAPADIINESFTRSWAVANIPTNSSVDHQADIQVTVAWTDAKGNSQKVVLASKIAWIDPGSGHINITSTGIVHPTIPFPSGGAKRGDGTATLDTTGLNPTENDDTNIDGQGDGTRTVTDAFGVNYLIDSGDVILLQSKNVFTTIRGIIALDSGASPAITIPANFALMNIVTSGVGFCAFPLIFSSDPATDGEPQTDNTVSIARYTCYVPEGWYGNVGVFGYDSNDNTCPARSRSYRGEIVSGGSVVSLFGLTLATAQSGDDFVVTDDCGTITIPTGITDTNSNGSPGPLEGTNVIIATQAGNIIISGTVTIRTATPSAGSTYSGLTLALTHTNGTGTCTSVTDTGSGYGTYSCNVDHRWSGTITLTADDTTDKVCFNGAGTIGSAISAHTAQELSNIIGENFDVVEGTVNCP